MIRFCINPFVFECDTKAVEVESKFFLLMLLSFDKQVYSFSFGRKSKSNSDDFEFWNSELYNDIN